MIKSMAFRGNGGDYLLSQLSCLEGFLGSNSVVLDLKPKFEQDDLDHEEKGL